MRNMGNIASWVCQINSPPTARQDSWLVKHFKVYVLISLSAYRLIRSLSMLKSVYLISPLVSGDLSVNLPPATILTVSS